MAVTIAQVRKAAEGSAKTNYVDITGPASYTTGGEALTQANLNALVGDVGSVIGDLNHFDAEVTSGGHTLYLNRATSKIQFFNGTTEIANATNLSTFTSRARIAKIFKP
jgi:hypothetical protein